MSDASSALLGMGSAEGVGVVLGDAKELDGAVGAALVTGDGVEGTSGEPHAAATHESNEIATSANESLKCIPSRT